MRVEHLSHTNRCRSHTSIVRRPDTSRSHSLRRRVSCTRTQRNPHAGQRDRLTVDSTSTLSSLGVSDATASTRISRRCNRTPHNIGGYRGHVQGPSGSRADSHSPSTARREDNLVLLGTVLNILR